MRRRQASKPARPGGRRESGRIPGRGRAAAGSRGTGSQQQTLLIALGVGGAVLLVVVLLVLGSGGSPSATDDRTAESPSKRPPKARTPAEPAPPQKTPAPTALDRRFAEARDAVRAALAKDDIVAATQAVSGFKFELVGATGAERYADAAFELGNDIERHARALFERMATQIRAQSARDHDGALAQLAVLKSTLAGLLGSELEQLAREVEAAAPTVMKDPEPRTDDPGRPSDPTPPVTPPRPPKPKPPVQPRPPDQSDVGTAPWVKDTLENRRYELLDRTLDTYIRTRAKLKERDQLLSEIAFDNLSVIGQRLRTVEDWAGWRTRLEAWRKTSPTSVHARVALARMAIREAWRSRGGGYANTVTQAGWKGFHAKIKEARAELAAARKLIARVEPKLRAHPSYYLALQTCHLAESDRQGHAETFTRASKLIPECTSLYASRANALLPRWFGRPGDLQAFASWALTDSPHSDRKLAHARVVGYLVGAERGDTFAYHEGGHLRWSTTREALEHMARLYPTTESLAWFCRVAFRAGDRTTTRRLVENLGGRISHWTPRQWNECKQWATTPTHTGFKDQGVQVLRRQGKKLAAAGRSDVALRVYELALEIDQNDHTLMLKSMTLAHLGQKPAALEALKQAIALSPDNPFLALFQAGFGDASGKARLEAAAARDDWPANIARHYLGQMTEADLLKRAAQAHSALQRDGQLCEAYGYMGLLAERDRQRRKARGYYLKCTATESTKFLEYLWAQMRLTKLR